MSEQPEALSMADELDGIPLADMTEALADDAAAELRRLHAEHIEDQSVIAVWRGRTLRAEQQRDELLQALKLAQSIIGHPDDAHSQHIAAVIARAEGEGK